MNSSRKPSRLADRVAVGSLAFIAYTYAGYPLLLGLLALARHRRARPAVRAATVAVSVIIAAFNEESTLGQTLSSLLASRVPAGAMEIIVVSDASTDGTDEVVRAYAGRGVRLIRQPKRGGQIPAFERAVAEARHGVLLFADAGEIFPAPTVARLARAFADSRVGAVSGAKITLKTGTAVSKGDHLYTRFDAGLRALESRTGGSWVGCEGGLYAIRKSLFKIDFPLSVAADNALCYRLYQRGYRHLFDPRAVVHERPSRDLGNEFNRKVRIIVTQLRGMAFFRGLSNPLRYPGFVFQNVSHKVFRWSVPFALMALLVSCARSRTPALRLLFPAQTAFYALALAGIRLKRHGAVPWVLSFPAYVTTVNAAGLVAWSRLLTDYSIWQPPVREAVPLAVRRTG